MKLCTKCHVEKPITDYYKRGDSDRPKSECKECTKKSSTDVSEWRRKLKADLVAEHGGRCLDCGHQGPAYHFDFDHRDPSVKSFNVSNLKMGVKQVWEEAKKCDLVCALCHRDRTHKQRCSGCESCTA